MNIQFNNNKPFIEGVYIDDIIQFHETPFYLYSQEIITNALNHLKNNLSSEIFYSVKANSNQAILTLINQLGAGADVVSLGELKRALKAGFKPNKIIYEGVGKTKKEIKYAIQKKIRLINIESFDEIKLVNKTGKELNKIVDIGIRLNPNINAKTLNKISTGKKADKFGIEIAQIDEIINLCKKSKNIKLVGISCHVGSQIHDIKVFKKVFLKMKKTAEFISLNNLPLKYVDLGGGFGVNLNIKNLGKILKLIFSKTPYSVSFEPGRYIVAKAGIIITRILSTKKNGGIKYLITDAGMHTLLRPALYAAKHRVQALHNIDQKINKYTIAGPICESSDIISKNILLPEQQCNNYLAIYDTGAYGAVMASNYNSRGLPLEILINKSNFSVVREFESINELIKHDKIPNWLKVNS